LQFFENRPTELIHPTMEALVARGALQFLKILREAVDRWMSRKRPKLETVEDFIYAARVEEFNDLDRAYYDQQPTLMSFLESYLAANFNEFIVIDG